MILCFIIVVLSTTVFTHSFVKIYNYKRIANKRNNNVRIAFLIFCFSCISYSVCVKSLNPCFIITVSLLIMVFPFSLGLSFYLLSTACRKSVPNQNNCFGSMVAYLVATLLPLITTKMRFSRQMLWAKKCYQRFCVPRTFAVFMTGSDVLNSCVLTRTNSLSPGLLVGSRAVSQRSAPNVNRGIPTKESRRKITG